jgi:nuclear receptor interaction protein
MSAEEEELMGQATQCVRKFSPRGQKKMKSTENGHITALKISDARPNEMIASWSGDHIYSFDLVRSPDAAEYEPIGPLRSGGGKKAKDGKDRKRKRQTNGSSTSLSQTGAARQSSRPRTDDEDTTYLHIRYQNGQAENISLAMESQPEQQRSAANVLTAKEREAQRIAKATVNIRSSLFSSTEEGKIPEAKYTAALGQAAGILFDMEDVMRDWGYPIDPEQEMVAVQQTLRLNRESARRFVQAAGTLSRVLGGKLQTPNTGMPLIASFTSVEPKSNELPPSAREHFGYDFLKAILLWLESGLGKLIEGFTRPEEMLPGVKAARRLPIPASDSDIEAIDEYLIPYLLSMAEDKAIVNVEANKFETDDSRALFKSEKAAVLAFAAAVKIPFQDLSSAVILAEGSDQIQAQDRQTALRYWGSKVARGILLNAAEGVNFTFVDRAFGGLGRVVKEVAAEETRMEAVSEGEDQPVESVEVRDANDNVVDGATADDLAAGVRQARQDQEDDIAMGDGEGATESTALLEGAEEVRAQRATVEEGDDDNDQNNNDEDEDMDDDSDDDERDDSSSDLDEEDGVPSAGIPRFLYASSYRRRRMREKVGADVPCSSYIKCYRGHCNVKTVKDVNYFGLDDEYIVSGSDDGNFFIWDRKTSELVNVLEGDGEVVNVIQGHPYETMMAVSGIDHTIKIFSPDARARENARLGRGITSHDSSEFSSLAFPSRLGRRRVGRRSEGNAAHEANGPTTVPTTSEPAVPQPTAEEEDDDENYVAHNGLASRRRMQDSYRIMNQNDVERQGGNQDAFLTVRDLHPLLLIMGRAFW